MGGMSLGSNPHHFSLHWTIVHSKLKNAVAHPAPCLLSWQSKRVIVPLTAIALGAALLPVSEPFFKSFYRLLHNLPLKSLFETATHFSSFFTIVVVTLLIYLLDRPKAFLLPYLVIALLTAGSVTSIIKEVSGRARPQWSVVMSDSKLAQLTEFSSLHPRMHLPVKKADFWLGPRLNRPFWSDKYASFPSGHTTAAFVMAAFLSILYPNARIVWYMAAISCGLARVYAKRHYMEDVLIGGGIASLVAYWVYSWHWPYTFTEQLRSRIRKRSVRAVKNRTTFTPAQQPRKV